MLLKSIYYYSIGNMQPIDTRLSAVILAQTPFLIEKTNVTTNVKSISTIATAVCLINSFVIKIVLPLIDALQSTALAIAAQNSVAREAEWITVKVI